MTTRKAKEPLPPRYSGELSREFWARVAKLRLVERREIYSLGVALQNLEHQVLLGLHNAEQPRRR